MEQHGQRLLTATVKL